MPFRSSVSFVKSLKDTQNVIVSGDVDTWLAELVIISLFTDARANQSDELPDGSNNLRGWMGDTFENDHWGSKLWLLWREKITTEVRNRAVKYAEDALKWMISDGFASQVIVAGSIPRFQTLALSIDIVKPDKSKMSITVNNLWSEISNAL